MMPNQNHRRLRLSAAKPNGYEIVIARTSTSWASQAQPNLPLSIFIHAEPNQ